MTMTAAMCGGGEGRGGGGDSCDVLLYPSSLYGGGNKVIGTEDGHREVP